MIRSLQYMDKINVASNLKRPVMKLLFKLREKWRIAACELQERRGNRATFPDLVNFIEQEVKILSNPVFGNIQETQTPISTFYFH